MTQRPSKERLEEIRKWHKCEDIPELLAEIDQLREKLALAVEALEEISDNESMYVIDEIIKEALAKIRGEK